MRIGYLRSEGSQDEIDKAIAAIEGAGSDRVVLDSTPGSRSESSAALAALLARMKPDDTLVVTHLEQLSRNTDHLLERLADLIGRGVKVEVLSGELDLSDPVAGRSIVALWEFARRKRGAGRSSRAGRTGAVSSGRPRRRAADDVAKAREMIEVGRRPVAEVARELGISRATLYRALRRPVVPNDL